MTTSSWLIPVVFPNHSDGNWNALPFTGHVGTIVVDSDGNATYYEFGNYQPGTPFVVTDNSSGNIRSMDLGQIPTDNNGQLDPYGITNALNQLTGPDGIYNGDPGTNNYVGATVVSPFQLSQTQFDQVKDYVDDSASGDVNLGNYNLVTNNCEGWVEQVADAGNVNIGINTEPGGSYNPYGIYPETAPDEILNANPLGYGYDYYPQYSWHANGVTLVGSSDNQEGILSWANPDETFDQWDGAWLTAMMDAQKHADITSFSPGIDGSLNHALFVGLYSAFWVGQQLINTSLQIQRIFGASEIKPDPLVIDLTGKGLNLTSLSGSTAEFDYNGSGLEENTAWVGTGTGLLVLPNAQGQVTNGTELFGPTSGNGFTDLLALDSNHDGKITSADAQFANLRIWQDTNGNGIVDPGELETLAQAGITSISLGYTSENVTLKGNTVAGYSTVSFSNGTTTTADEVDFAANLLNTQPNPNETQPQTISTTIQNLPWIKGYGQLTDLDISMTNDATLQQDVTNLTNVAVNDFGDFDTDTTAILYEWAGVTNVNPNSRGGYFDARSLETMEHFTGINWIHVGQGNVGPYHPYVIAAWDELFGAEELDLALQTSFEAYLSGLQYDMSSNNDIGLLNLSVAVSALPTDAPSGETGELFGLNGWINFLELVKSNPAILTDFGSLTTTIASSAVAGIFGGYWIGNTSLSNFLQADGSEYFLYGNGWSGSIAAQSGIEIIDTGDGNVAVSSPDGNKLVFTGTGSDTLNLQGGNNFVTLGTGSTTVQFNGSKNTAITTTGNDTITFNGSNSTGNSVTTGTGPAVIVFNGGSGSVVSGSANTSVEVGISDLFSMYDIPGSFAIASPASIVFTSNEYAGAITLSGDMQFSGNRYSGLYNLVFLPAGGTSPYTMGAPATGDIGTIVVDTAGNDALVFDDAGSVDTDYWVANDGTDTATLLAGKLDIEMAGPQSDYTVGYDGVSTLTLTDTGDVDGTGTKTITLTGGQGQIVFGDGSVIGLGNSQSISGEPVQYGTAGNDYFDVEGTELVEGGGGSNVADLEGSSHVPDNSWIIGENATGGVETTKYFAFLHLRQCERFATA